MKFKVQVKSFMVMMYLKVCQLNDVFDPKDHSSVSHGMNLKQIETISHILITDLTVSMHKTSNGIKIPTKPVSVAEDMTPGSFHCYQLHIETLFVPEQRYILTWGYVMKQIAWYKTNETDL